MRFVEIKYPCYCWFFTTQLCSPKEQVILDENKVAEGLKFCDVGDISVSPSSFDLIAYGVDAVGKEVYNGVFCSHMFIPPKNTATTTTTTTTTTQNEQEAGLTSIFELFFASICLYVRRAQKNSNNQACVNQRGCRHDS